MLQVEMFRWRKFSVNLCFTKLHNNNSTETNFILCVQLENDVFAKFTPCQINDAYTLLCDKEMFHNHIND
jgi:hypothetical protein